MRRTPRIDDMPSIRRRGERSSRPDSHPFENRRSVPYEADWGPTPPPGVINGLTNPVKTSRPSGGRVNGLRTGRTNGLGSGRINGLRSGRTNGLPGGRINGLRKELVYGFTNGRVNGLRNGKVNGLKNGKVNGLKNGRVNGLANGRVNGLRNGRTNGNGYTNGNGRKNGLINGNGFINGFRLTSAPRIIPLSKENPSVRIIGVFAVVALVVIIPFLLVYSMPEDVIKIDGYFFDWDRAGYFSEPAGNAVSSIDIREYSVVVSGATVYGYVSTDTEMFPAGRATPTSFFVFFEMDDNPQTGYIIDGIGADTMVEISGWNGTVKPGSSSVYDFSSVADRNDFVGFGMERDISVMGAGNKIEFSFQKNGVDSPVARFFSKSCVGCQDVSQYSIRYGEPALRIETNYTMPQVVQAGTWESVMELELTTLRGDARISKLRFTELGNATAYSISVHDGVSTIGSSDGPEVSFAPAVEVREGYGRLLSVRVSAGAGQDGSSFGISLNSSGVNLSGEVTTTVEEEQHGAKVAYIGAVPGGVVIDGAFGDWVNGYVVSDKAGDVELQNGTLFDDGSIDILEYGMYLDESDVSMYLFVEDLIMNGTIIPKDVRLPVPSTGLPPLTSPEALGTDIAGAVIDADWNLSTGANYNDMLGADYLVLVTGKKGRIVASALYSWNPAGNGSWEFKDDVRAAVDSRHMELAFAFSNLPLGDFDIAAVGFFMTDWKEGMDFSDGVLPLGKWQIGTFMKAFGGIMINEVLNNKKPPTGADWIELYNTGSQPITLTGWRIYDGTTLIRTLGTITINPGGFYVVSGLTISKTGAIRLTDQNGGTIDACTAKEDGNGLSYSRTGGPPYSTWRQNTPPTPGAVNPGQIPIPEFSDVILPVILILVMFFLMRMRGRRGKDGQS
jgi:hypothetical protein